jgi:hypothetical protein
MASSPFCAIGGEDDLEILLRVAERALPVHHRVVIGQRQERRRLEILERHHVVGKPLGVRLFRRKPRLDFLVVNDPALFGIDQEDTAGVQPLLEENVLLRNVQHAHF